MIACEWTERVALHAGGDRSPEVEQHVRTCADCRELLAELLADREAISQPPHIPDRTYEVVRARVLTELRARQQRRFWGSAAAAVLLAAMAGAAWIAYVLYGYVPALDVRVAHPAVAAVPVASIEEPARTQRTVPVRRTRRPPQSEGELAMALRDALGPLNTAPAASDAPVLITALTADPDVVIVLVPETRGEVNE